MQNIWKQFRQYFVFQIPSFLALVVANPLTTLFLIDGTFPSWHACGIKGKIYMLINIFSSFQKLSENFIFPFVTFRYQKAHTFVRNACCSVPNLPAAARVQCFLTTLPRSVGLISLL